MIPIVQIRQTTALIGIETTAGSLSIVQPKADLQINTTPGQLEIRQSPAEMTIDQTQARAAYTGGTYREMNQRIYSGIEQLWLQGIAKRMEQGERAANFHKSGNSIAEIYGEDWQPVSYPEIRGPASVDNVHINVELVPPEIEYRKSEVSIQAEAHAPQINFTPPKLDIYLRQRPSISFVPPEIDIQM
ncbi:hypothetical protein C162_12076 [Paenibacillus sp. FSL R7-269]|uniref:DUF6470 family protein n=1 Tax=Paenibacillus sp. FSL R7-269 TaxID=1226755 RepID=UPI0003E2B005|nr:DUF6470 family protein [Paenibacillus sp. FSL R7-269]ETT49972.1 hypothetical protein C162_12076 [Paenibacillus sp. FSL R7-269]